MKQATSTGWKLQPILFKRRLEMCKLSVCGSPGVFAVALALGMAWFAPPAMAQNLLIDPSFEINPLGSYLGVLNNFVSQQGVWGPEAATLTGAQGGVTPFSGAKMLRMTDDGLVVSQCVQVTDVTTFAGFVDGGSATFSLSGRFNVQNVPAAAAGLTMRFYTGPNVSLVNGVVSSGDMVLDANASTWQPISVSGPVPAGTRWVVSEVYYRNSTMGGMPGYFDSAELTFSAAYADRDEWQMVASSGFTLCEDFEAEPNATGWSTFELPHTTAGGIEIDRLASGTAQQFIRIGYNGTQVPHIRDFTAGITWNPGDSFTAFGFDYRASHRAWDIEIDVGGSAVVIGTLAPWSEGFVGFVLPEAVTSFTIRGGAGAQGGISIDNMCFGLDSPPPCPPCPPPGPLQESVYLITGNAAGANWSWKFESAREPGRFCAQDLCVSGVAATDDVDGDGHLGTPADVAMRFANSINDYSLANDCFFTLFAVVEPTPLPPARPKYAKLFIQYETAKKPTLSVGPCGDPSCPALFYLPSTGCPFNPLLHKMITSGVDCNSNGEDDLVDIVLGSSQDANQNQVPDECELMAFGLPHQPLGQASLSVDAMAGSLLVNNIGASGDDGMIINLPDGWGSGGGGGGGGGDGGGLGDVLGRAGIAVFMNPFNCLLWGEGPSPGEGLALSLGRYEGPETTFPYTSLIFRRIVSEGKVGIIGHWHGLEAGDYLSVTVRNAGALVANGTHPVQNQAPLLFGGGSLILQWVGGVAVKVNPCVPVERVYYGSRWWADRRWNVEFREPITITLPSGESVVGDHLTIAKLWWMGTPDTMYMDHAWFAGKLGEDNGFEITGVAPTRAGVSYSAIGQASFGTAQSGVTVSGLGSSGNDGVDVQFSAATTLQMQIEPLNPSSSSVFRSTARGDLAGDSDVVLGVVTLEQEGAALRATPDVSAIGATGYGARVYDGDDLVLSADDPQSIIIHEEWSLWDFIWFNGLWDLLWPTLANIEVDDGNQVWQVAGDRVQFVPLDPVAIPESIERVVLQAANIEEFVISEATSIPVCDASDFMVDLADFAVFVDCFSAPQVSYSPSCLCADLDSDGDIDLADFAMVQLLFGS